ncbi:MAG: NAD(P)-dependent glycerol-3-phosphate dehydrogenase [Verrucomicrobia bacterium]|nr:NAD(P)-dependent glycerol-3-phosphate dehydrogenase [Verrucomicrobiota bacterium]
MKVTVIGAGAWGTALAKLLAGNGHAITLWGHTAEHLAEMQGTARNEKYLPGVELPPDWHYEADAAKAASGAEFVVMAVPSKAFREVGGALENFSGPVVSVTKGIEFETGLTMSGVLAQVAPRAKIAALSGPTLAAEVARGAPTACVVASRDEAVARLAQSLFHGITCRVYTSTDLIGVELGGALKNVIALAAGVSDGLRFGDSSKASLVTRGIVEMRRLGVACGAEPETFAGLSGLGDLTVTCFSKHSRNRGLGERFGRGEKLADILASMVAVAEGVPTARSAFQLAQRLKVQTPIIAEVHAALYEGKSPKQAVMDLMGRESRAEA